MTKTESVKQINKFNLKKISPLPNAPLHANLAPFLPFAWLFSSIFFFLISSVIAPMFWVQFDYVDQFANSTPLNLLLGLGGIFIYCSEPFIWHNLYGNQIPAATDEKSQTAVTTESWFSLLGRLLLYGVMGLLIAAPYVGIMIFKPIFRAMILYVSLRLLNVIGVDIWVHPLFIVPVVFDILLYYFGQFLPAGKFNPIPALTRWIKIKNPIPARILTNITIIAYTALIYSLLLHVFHHDIQQNPDHLSLKNLSWWWWCLTVYVYIPRIPDDFDADEFFASIPNKTMILTGLSIIISYLSFIWPFYFAPIFERIS